MNWVTKFQHIEIWRRGIIIKNKLTNLLKWLAFGLSIKRWIALFFASISLIIFILIYIIWKGEAKLYISNFLNHISFSLEEAYILLLIALIILIYSIIKLQRIFLKAIGTLPEEAVKKVHTQHTLKKGVKIVAIGGGTGLSNLLMGLKNHSSNLTAIVTVSDDGGSSGILRQNLDMIAPGDLTDCYAALSENIALSELLLHRFERGKGLKGHTFGNLLLATLSEKKGGLAYAMPQIHEILHIQGQVYPATTAYSTLVFYLEDGREVRGESNLAHNIKNSKVKKIVLEANKLPTLKEVRNALENAEIIILGPGSLFTSILAVCLVPDIRRRIVNSKAPLIYVASLMSEAGETTDMTLQDHENSIAEHIGKKPDYILVNSSKIPEEILKQYKEAGSEPIKIIGTEKNIWYADVAHFHKGKIRHDHKKLAREILKISKKLKGKN